jgi:hypothetical protein
MPYITQEWFSLSNEGSCARALIKKGRKPKYDVDKLPSKELLEHDLKIGKISESTYYRYRKKYL